MVKLESGVEFVAEGVDLRLARAAEPGHARFLQADDFKNMCSYKLYFPGQTSGAKWGALEVVRTIRRIHHWLEGTDLTANLPGRVKDMIDKQQHASEILIGRVQLAFILLMAALYVASPKGFSEGNMFAPVPWAIVLYLSFTLMRLWLAHRRTPPRALLVASVVIDMTLLLGLIFSFHIQYEQPPAFYLKSPTLLYVFIFISIRALRFDPGYVVLSGTVAAVGWMLLAGYAVWFAPDSMGITRDFVDYMTSSRILLGAELDKVVSIGVVTTILAIGISRARRNLVESVTEQMAVQDLARFLPEQVVDRLRHSATRLEAGYCEAGEATILYVDIESFTTIGEGLPPATLVATLNDYFAAVAGPINRSGGVICQFQGDAILASFNMPNPDLDHAARAVHAAREILKLVERRTFGDGIRLSVRIGINTGHVVGGLVGTPSQVGYTIHGNDVNLAARLEQLNKHTGTRLLVSESTRELAGDEGAGLVETGTFEIRGQTRPVTVYRAP